MRSSFWDKTCWKSFSIILGLGSTLPATQTFDSSPWKNKFIKFFGQKANEKDNQYLYECNPIAVLGPIPGKVWRIFKFPEFKMLRICWLWAFWLETFHAFFSSRAWVIIFGEFSFCKFEMRMLLRTLLDLISRRDWSSSGCSIVVLRIDRLTELPFLSDSPRFLVVEKQRLGEFKSIPKDLAISASETEGGVFGSC